MNLPIKEIARRLGLPEPQYDTFVSTLLTDSRSLENPEGTLFFAIPTDGNDGHRYIGRLYREGVRNFVVNTIPPDMRDADGVNWFVTENTVLALQRITARPDDFAGEVLAITGSRGKTTLKEWIYQLMEPFSDISRSPRSFNSQIGVPLSMWAIDPNASLAIIEAGVSRQGEMKNLAECIRPDTVIFTNIGDAHSEGFNSREEKARQKAILADTDRTSTVIYNADSPELSSALADWNPKGERIAWSFHDKKAPLFISGTRKDSGETTIEYTFKSETHSFSILLENENDMENTANALAFMLHAGVKAPQIAERFGQLHKIGTRLNVTEGVNGCAVILDSYTSDFSSLRPAIDFMKRRRMLGQTATLILSDLHHETADPDTLYGEIAALVRHAGIDRFIGVGDVSCAHAAMFPENSLFFRNTTDLLSGLSTSDFCDEIIMLKGSPEFNFREIADMLEARKHETVLEVNLDSIVANYNYFRSHTSRECGIICMVKASGYGAGSYEIAKTLQDCGARYLAVAVLDEGLELRRKGITMPIMVMNPKVLNYRSMFANRLEPEIYSLDMLRDVIQEAEKNGIKDYPIHIKLDTGMHRMGFIEKELPALTEILAGTRAVKAASLFSHLATADCPDMDDFTLLQLSRFRKMTDIVISACPYPIMRHVLNSAGILRFPEHQYDMVRLGIGLYGANTLPPEMERPLAVVSTLRTVIIAIREWEPGETIGYGRYGKIEKPSRIATLPIGYADGMNRHFGRGAVSVYVNGKEAPTIGNICMDACMIDVTGIDCKVGDSVEIFGQQAPLQRLADALDTIPYEILTSVSPRVKRIYYRE